MAQNSYPYPIFDNKVVESAGNREPWLRRPDESKRAVEAFSLWLRAEPRSLTHVAGKLSPPCSKANVARWSARHLWQSRAFAWDAEQEELQRQQFARDRVSMRKRHLQVAMLMQSIAAHGLAELAAKVEQKLPLNMKPEEAKALMDSGTKLERTTVGPERDRRFTKINVIFGTHRYPGEKCDCTCPACASCHGAEVEVLDDESPIIDGDEPKKLN
jgi:hypothetical protein